MDRLNIASTQLGEPWPLGAHFDGEGINFAVFSAHAQAMDLCLFDSHGTQELARLRLSGRTGDIWHGYLPNAEPGLVYGLRASGPWRPDRGHRFDVSKLLLDPYARDIVGDFRWLDEHFTPDPMHPRHLVTRDNAATALKARVVHDAFDWNDDRPPAIALDKTVIYECHVKGFTQTHPDIPTEIRGTYAGLGHPVAISHLKTLGITTVSLLPVHYYLSEQRLVTMGLSNYWGYNTLGFFCPSPQLASGLDGISPRDEFRTMVRALHAAGLEVILDVVYNHTAESDHSGPTLSFRGLDNASYYRLIPNDLSHYENYSGCGNTMDIRQPRVLQLVMDSLRYWVNEMHVDGFRFDLATVLGRTDNGFSAQAAFFAAVAQDPILCRVKMIAEPWDIGPGGYQVGQFPRGWLEWNDQFRDSLRRFWVQSAASPLAVGSGGTLGDFAMRLCGSSDLYQGRMREPAESINYIISHDGFTLLDLLSYNHRHNLANGEGNRDGQGTNLNFNCGCEGPSADDEVHQLRQLLQRALLASNLLAQGTPMICAGDELGHSQAGNNNPYCQDNATTWIDWSQVDTHLLAFTRYVIGLRQSLQPFANIWYSGIANADGIYDLSWWNADGSAVEGAAWQLPQRRALGCLIGKPGNSSSPLLLLVNNAPHTEHFMLPQGRWQGLLDTSHPVGLADWHGLGGSELPIAAHSLLLLQKIVAHH